MLFHELTVVCFETSCQYTFVLCHVNIAALKMNSEAMLDIISSVFKQIYKGTFLCEPCFIQELQHHAFSISNMLIHIYSHHRDLWDVHIFQVSSLSHHAWYKLFKFSGCSLVRCKTCHRVFLNARLEDLHYHTRTHHGILLLALSLSHLN